MNERSPFDSVPNVWPDADPELDRFEEFMRGFCDATGLDRTSAMDAWIIYAQRMERKGQALAPRVWWSLARYMRNQETKGYERGLEIGRDYREMDKPVVTSACHGKCTRENNACGAMGPNNYYCTLPKGHAGKHVACSTDEHAIECWPLNPNADVKQVFEKGRWS